MHHPGPGQAEQDPEEFVAAALSAMGEVVAKAAIEPCSVAAIAFSGQMGGAMAIDRHGQALTPWYPSTLDVRYQPYLQPVLEAAGLSPAGLGRGRADPGAAHCLVARRAACPLWTDRQGAAPGQLRSQRGCAASPAMRSAVIASYLTWTGLADTARRTWSDELADLWGVSLDRLPRIVGGQ